MILNVGEACSTVSCSNLCKKGSGFVFYCTRITWVSFLGSEESSLKLLRSAKLQCTNSSPISNCRRWKSAIFVV